MGDFIAAFLLAVIQGITEWLPISSSGHLVIFEHLLSYNGGLFFEVALHFGTLMAVFVYFGKDIVDIVRDVLQGKFETDNAKIGVRVIIASIPVAIIGFLFLDFFESLFNSLVLTAWGFAITGLFLLIASLDIGKRAKKVPGYIESILIGFAQVVSILPGISRSGATISSGLLSGLDPKSAAKFSFLMSIPVIFGANIIVIGNRTLPPEMIWATLISFIIGLGVIHFMFKIVLTSKKNLRWFALYALALALGIFSYLVF